MARYIVQYTHDADSNVWTAVIDRSQGVSCVTQGDSLEQVKERMRHALAAYLDDEHAAAQADLLAVVS
jgi:predicted RNase H-like HicB family nuclease